jgi:hypothetical protein
LKKIFAISVLFFVLFNSMGYYILFELDKMMVKKEMRAKISDASAVLVCLKIEGGDENPSFQRINKKEFRFNGRLYDIVREVDKGGSKVIFCIPDSKEDRLFSGLKRVHHHNQRINLWDHIVQVAIPESTLTLTYLSPEDLIFPRLEVSFYSSVLPTWSPPPERS